jgi:hypothetical protein
VNDVRVGPCASGVRIWHQDGTVQELSQWQLERLQRVSEKLLTKGLDHMSEYDIDLLTGSGSSGSGSDGGGASNGGDDPPDNGGGGGQ